MTCDRVLPFFVQ